jgi:endonuclease-3
MSKEGLKAKIERARKIVRLLKQNYPNSQCSLNFKTVHQLMVATILSAQCTDERVNIVTGPLFKKYRTVKAFAEADQAELEQDIFTTGFFRNKAKAIIGSAQALLKSHKGTPPKQLEQLVKLPGVGRKTASVILGAGYGLAEGVVVDTHVGRISRRLGFTKETSPEKVEQELMKIIPHDDWIIYSHLLIDHGRALCQARKPNCENCFLADLCPKIGV